jgi:enamine deaminase RidA (YjgF/YER057c/UK114 family)
MRTTRKLTYYLPLAAVMFVAGAAVAAPFQQAIAQQQDTQFLIRLVQGTAQTGLVNVSVQVGNVIVSDVIDVTGNNVAIPITIPIAANVNVIATVCATILSSGDQVCKTVADVEQDAVNRVTLNLRQAQ